MPTKRRKARSKAADQQWKFGFCRVCASYCPIAVRVESGKAVEVRGDREAPLYDGYTCPKGRSLPLQHNNPARLLHSRKRTGKGQHRPIAAAKAMDEISSEISDIVEQHGPGSVALYFGTGIAGFPEVANVAAGFMQAIGSRMIFSANAIDKPGAQVAQAAHGIWSAWHPPFSEADAWLIIGLNPIISKSGGFPPNNPGRRLKDAVRERDFKLIAIDPRKTETAAKAAVHLQAQPGEDPVILAAMIRIIIEEGLADEEFVARHVDGFQALREAVAPFTPEFAAQRADIDADKLIEAARIFGTARSAGVGTGVGPSFSLTGALTDYLGLCLTTICGFWSREGEWVSKPNVLLPDWTPRAEAKPPFPGSELGPQLNSHPVAPSAAGMPTGILADEILLEGNGRIRALICLGGNPMMAWPDQHKAFKALNSLDLLVTCDHEMTDTSVLSDYVIAPRLSLETPAVSALLENIRYIGHTRGIDGPYAQYCPSIVEDPAGSDLIDDWKFFHGLASRMNLPLRVTMTYGMGAHKEAESFEVMLQPYEDLTSDQLIERLYANARVPLSKVKQYPHGNVFTDADQQIAPPAADNSARLNVGDHDILSGLEIFRESFDQHRQADGEFRLLPRRANRVMNSGGRNTQVRAQDRINPAYINPDDAASLGLEDGQFIMIVGPGGEITTCAMIDNSVRSGCISMTHGFGRNPDLPNDPTSNGANVGRLMTLDAGFDPITGIPRMGNLAVTITPLPQMSAAKGETESPIESEAR